MYYPSDARNAKGLEFLFYQLAFRIKRGIRCFQCWCGIREIRKFNFSVFDYPNGEFKVRQFLPAVNGELVSGELRALPLPLTLEGGREVRLPGLPPS